MEIYKYGFAKNNDIATRSEEFIKRFQEMVGYYEVELHEIEDQHHEPIRTLRVIEDKCVVEISLDDLFY